MPRPARIPRRKMRVEHIERQVRKAKREGIVYSSIDELLEDELEQERGLSRSQRRRLRQKRLALTGADEHYAGEVVSQIAKGEEFDILAIVREFQHAVHLLEMFWEAMGHAGKHGGKQPKLKVVQDDLDDEEKLASMLSRVSQVIHLSAFEAPKGDAASAVDSSVRPVVVVANACRKASIDRIILASTGGKLSNALFKNQQDAASDSSKTPALAQALSEDAVRLCGVPYVFARFPVIWGKNDQLLSLLQEKEKTEELKRDFLIHIMHEQDVARAFGLILLHPRVQNQELNFVGERLSREQCFEAVFKAAGTPVPKRGAEQDAADRFLLRAVENAEKSGKPQVSGKAGPAGAGIADRTRIRTLLGFSPSITFQRGPFGFHGKQKK